MIRRQWLPLAACLASASFATVGGACRYGSAPAAPSLHDGQYVLIAAGSQFPPQVSFVDASGRRIRVVADTIQIETATRHYIERGSVAVTPVGGSELAPTPIALGTQTYVPTSESQFDLPVTIAGVAHGSALLDNTLDLRMPDGSHWTLRLR